MEQFHWWVSLFPRVKESGDDKCLCFGLGTYLSHQRPQNHWVLAPRTPLIALCHPFTFTPCALMNSSSINHSCFSALSQLICLPVFPFLFHQTPTLLLFSISSCYFNLSHISPPCFYMKSSLFIIRQSCNLTHRNHCIVYEPVLKASTLHVRPDIKELNENTHI